MSIPAITPTEFKARTTAWLDCLPSKVSDLFYYVTSSGVDRVAKYKLEYTSTGTMHSKRDDNTAPTAVRIYMGCKDDVFAPIFVLVYEDGFREYYDLKLVEEPTEIGPRTEAEIPKAIAELFTLKWFELTDLQAGDAFSGVTYVNIDQAGHEAMRRVKYYSFDAEDTVRIFQHLQQSGHSPNGDCGVSLLLGAGLSVRVHHPFNFRPIIQMDEAQGSDVTTTYFERAQPCPPYCKD